MKYEQKLGVVEVLTVQNCFQLFQEQNTPPVTNYFCNHNYTKFTVNILTTNGETKVFAVT